MVSLAAFDGFALSRMGRVVRKVGSSAESRRLSVETDFTFLRGVVAACLPFSEVAVRTGAVVARASAGVGCLDGVGEAWRRRS